MLTELPDLDSRIQVHHLVVAFYREIVLDDLLGPVFEEVAEVDWAAHIPRLIDYWCRILLREPGYEGYLLGAHRDVHRRAAFAQEHFDRWYGPFVSTIDRGWRGPIAERAKVHSATTAQLLSRRLRDADWKVPAATAAMAERAAGHV